MKISYSYRGEHKRVIKCSFRYSFANGGDLVITERSWSDGNKRVYSVAIEPDELLSLARKCLDQLSQISGIEYRVSASLDGSNHRIMDR